MQLNPVAFAQRKSVLPKNIFLAIIYILVLICLAVGVISFLSAWKITHPARVATPQISSNIAPDYKNVSFYSSESKEKINGWYFPSIGSKTTVLMIHGYSRNRLQFNEDTFKLITRLNNESLNVLTIDLRGSGNSAGSISTFGRTETSDVLTGIKYLKQQGTEKIILMGFSTGASSCLSAITQTPYRDSILGIIADSPYAKVENYVDYATGGQSWLPEYPFKFAIEFMVEKLAKINGDMDIIPKIPAIIPTPLLLIDGAQKELSSSDNTKLLYELYFRKSPVPVHYWNSGTQIYGQSFLAAPDKYMDTVSEFIRECIAEGEKGKK